MAEWVAGREGGGEYRNGVEDAHRLESTVERVAIPLVFNFNFANGPCCAVHDSAESGPRMIDAAVVSSIF